MIKKYNEYIKESLLDKLEGPTREEVWVASGGNYFFDETPNSPKDFLDKIIENSTESIKKDKLYYRFNGEIYLINIELLNSKPRKVDVSKTIGKVLLKFFYDDLKSKYGNVNKSWLLKYFYRDYFNCFEVSESSIYWTDITYI